MEPLFRAVVLGLVPQPRQIPPEPFAVEDLQRAFFDVSREHTYQQFQFLPGEAGAQFANSPEDGVMIQPGLIQVRAPIDSTPEFVRERTTAIVKIIAKRLALTAFLQAGLKVVAHVPISGSAKEFIGGRLMRDAEAVKELGPDYFAGGVKYRSLQPVGQFEENLLIEPLVEDDGFLYLDYDAQRGQQFEVDQISTWIDEAFDFVRGPAMRLLATEI